MVLPWVKLEYICTEVAKSQRTKGPKGQRTKGPGPKGPGPKGPGPKGSIAMGQWPQARVMGQAASKTIGWGHGNSFRQSARAVPGPIAKKRTKKRRGCAK